MAEGFESIAELFRQARRRQGLTQSQVAREVGCKQSAISMFEAGRADALSQEKQQKLAELLGIAPEFLAAKDSGHPGRVPLALKFCPIPDCPSNIPYFVAGRLCLRPAMVQGVRGAREWCASCGEVLEESCPNESCRAEVQEGAFCRKCGTAYVPAVNLPSERVAEWADAQLARIREIRTLSASERRVSSDFGREGSGGNESGSSDQGAGGVG